MENAVHGVQQQWLWALTQVGKMIPTTPPQCWLNSYNISTMILQQISELGGLELTQKTLHLK